MAKRKKKRKKKDLKKKTLFITYFILVLNQNSTPKFSPLQICFEYFSKGILAFPLAFTLTVGGFPDNLNFPLKFL